MLATLLTAKTVQSGPGCTGQHSQNSILQPDQDRAKCSSSRNGSRSTPLRTLLATYCPLGQTQGTGQPALLLLQAEWRTDECLRGWFSLLVSFLRRRSPLVASVRLSTVNLTSTVTPAESSPSCSPGDRIQGWISARKGRHSFVRRAPFALRVLDDHKSGGKSRRCVGLDLCFLLKAHPGAADLL